MATTISENRSIDEFAWQPSFGRLRTSLGSTVLTTNGSGTTLADEGYYAYGLRRRSGELGTENRFTGHPSTWLRNQKLDGVGLQYFNAQG